MIQGDKNTCRRTIPKNYNNDKKHKNINVIASDKIFEYHKHIQSFS